jgi:hypothetical protein
VVAVLGIAAVTFTAPVPTVAGLGPGVAAAEPLEFDPVLSLTGTCTTSNLDEVPDPGCPATHAPHPLSQPSGTAVDSHGDIYVGNIGPNTGTEGRFDIFDPAGHFLTEFLAEPFPETIAVDSQCRLYVQQQGERTLRYTPDACPPGATTTFSGPVTVDPSVRAQGGIAVDPTTDDLYVRMNKTVFKYSPNGEILDQTIGEGALFTGASAKVAIDGATGDIYTSTTRTESGVVPTPEEPFVSIVKVFGGGAGHPLKYTIDGSDTPEGGFRSPFAHLGLAVDETNGELFVNDTLGSNHVYQFQLNEVTNEYEYVATIEHSFQDVDQAIAFDSNIGSSNQGHLFVTSHPSGVGHLFAFGPRPAEIAPVIMGEAFSGLSTTEATLEGQVNPGGLATHFRFEYVDDATFQADVAESGAGHGFDHASKAPVPDAELVAGGASAHVSQGISGLQPATMYHFRIVAENALGVAEGEREGAEEVEHVFVTYSFAGSGFSNGRAYELVTPPDTNGRLPTATGIGTGDGFETDLFSPGGPGGGPNLIFETVGGSLPGAGGTGAINGDVYQAERGATGWGVSAAEPSGAESQAPSPGGYSADHRYSFWTTGGGGVNDQGSLVINGKETHYERLPDGSFALIGTGDTGEVDPQARGRWITPGATHLIFTSPVQLAQNAPPRDTAAAETGTVYDRTSDGVTSVVSLLPEDIPPASATEITYGGASADGSAVAFMVGTTLYEHRDQATLRVEEGSPVFAGISRDGNRVFFVKGGNIFAFDADEGTTTPIGSGGESTVVNVSADGSHVLFVSLKRLGGQGKSGKDNLYVWSDGAVRFIGTLEHIDVTGQEEGVSGFFVGGLGLWTTYAFGRVGPDAGPANDPSRSTADGRFFVFQSRANLTGYDSEGHPEVYRYDSQEGSLMCVSCNPTLAAAVSGGQLESLSASGNQFAPGNSLAPTHNITEDGQEVFFETKDALAPGDVDGAQDVYEWVAEGGGGCAQPDGCLSLVSSGHSAAADYLYAVSHDGHDVFFRTGDRLLPVDSDATPSIYDARVGGGFPEGEPSPCQDEACRGSATSPPSLPEIASSGMSGTPPRHRCHGKASRRDRGRRVHCKKAHRRHRHHKHRGGGSR